MAVSAYHSPHLGVALIGPISVLLWTLFFRYIFMFVMFPRLKCVVITGQIKSGKHVCLQDGKRIYIDCADANFGTFFPFLSNRSSRALIKARLRNNSEMEVYKYGDVYVYQRGRLSLIPIVLPIFTTGLVITDLFQIFNGD